MVKLAKCIVFKLHSLVIYGKPLQKQHFRMNLIIKSGLLFFFFKFTVEGPSSSGEGYGLDFLKTADEMGIVYLRPPNELLIVPCAV